MAIKKIDIKKHVQEFEIGSQVFELELRDEKLKEYMKTIKELSAKPKEEVDVSDDPDKAFSQVEEQSRMFLTVCFGEDAYDKIYEEVNGSTYILTQVVEDVSEEVEAIIAEMENKRKDKKKMDYYKKQTT